MASSPTITKRKFDSITPQFVAALKEWWQDEAQDFDAAVSGTQSVWDDIPEIDSKAVVKASPIVRQFTGVELDPKLIKQGGYESFDALVNDLLPKLRNLCSETKSAQHAAAHV